MIEQREILPDRWSRYRNRSPIILNANAPLDGELPYPRHADDRATIGRSVIEIVNTGRNRPLSC